MESRKETDGFMLSAYAPAETASGGPGRRDVKNPVLYPGRKIEYEHGISVRDSVTKEVRTPDTGR